MATSIEHRTGFNLNGWFGSTIVLRTLAVLTVFCLVSCGGGGSATSTDSTSSGGTSPTSSGSGSPSAGSAILYDPNPGESTIAVVNYEGENLLTYSGTKTATGEASSISDVVVDSIDQSPANRVDVFIGSNGQASVAKFVDGSSVNFNYSVQGQIILTVTDNAGEQEAFSLSTSTGVLTAETAAQANAAVRVAMKQRRPSLRQASSSSPASAVTGTVTVGCPNGNPISNANVSGFFVPNPDSIPSGLGIPAGFMVPVWPMPTGTSGTYSYQVPTVAFQADPSILQQLVASVPQALSSICDGADELEYQLLPGGIEAATNSAEALVSLYLGVQAGQELAKAIGALKAICEVNTALSTANSVVTSIGDVLQNGGTFQFSAAMPNAPTQTTTPAQYDWLSPSPPKVSITFPCISLTIAPGNPGISIGSNATLTATATDDNGNAVSLGTVSWGILPSDEGIASIASSGSSSAMVTGESQGLATVEATDPASGDSATTTLNVGITTWGWDSATTLPDETQVNCVPPYCGMPSLYFGFQYTTSTLNGAVTNSAATAQLGELYTGWFDGPESADVCNGLNAWSGVWFEVLSPLQLTITSSGLSFVAGPGYCGETWTFTGTFANGGANSLSLSGTISNSYGYSTPITFTGYHSAVFPP